jgi:WD40 repeat protein
MVNVRYLMVYCLTFSPDGRSLLVSSVKRLGRPTGYEIHETQLWRVADGNVFSLPRLGAVEFSVDGRTLAGASWSEEKPPGVWSTATGKLEWSRGDETDRTDRSTDGPEVRLEQIWSPEGRHGTVGGWRWQVRRLEASAARGTSTRADVTVSQKLGKRLWGDFAESVN